MGKEMWLVQLKLSGLVLESSAADPAKVSTVSPEIAYRVIVI